MVNVHSTAVVSSKAHLGENVTISPFAIVHDEVEIGDNTFIGPKTVIYDYTIIGNNVKIFQNASIGHIPQDLKFKGELTHCYIGDNSIIHEFVSIHRGTAASLKTTIGKNVYIMDYSHVAHDCIIEDNCIIANLTQLAGHVHIYQNAVIGGNVKILQFMRVGKFCMIQGGRTLNKDIPPYILAGTEEVQYGGLNSIGLRRNGFSPEQIQHLKKIYNYIFESKLNISQAKEKIKLEFPNDPFANEIFAFINESKIGIISK